MGNPSLIAPEIKWFHDSVSTNYHIILDMRNESAVAALALHEWQLYSYNNRIYTQLFKEMSADNTLGNYCLTMQQSQTNKTPSRIECRARQLPLHAEARDDVLSQPYPSVAGSRRYGVAR